MTQPDSEIGALRDAYTSLTPLSPLAQERALTWLSQKLTADRRAGQRSAMVVAAFARKVGRIRPRTAAPAPTPDK